MMLETVGPTKRESFTSLCKRSNAVVAGVRPVTTHRLMRIGLSCAIYGKQFIGRQFKGSCYAAYEIPRRIANDAALNLADRALICAANLCQSCLCESFLLSDLS